MSRSKSLTTSEGTGAASDTTPHSDTWRSLTAPNESLGVQDHQQRRHHQLYGKSRQPGKSDSFTSLQSTEQSSVIGSVAWSQIDIEERGTVSEGLESTVSRPQASGSNSISLAYTKEVHHLLWLASQASESRGAPPAIAAHLAVIAVSASQAAGMNLSQAALDVHTLWLQSLTGILTTKRGLLHSKMLHTATQSARTSSSQPRTSTSTASHLFDPHVSASTSIANHTASTTAEGNDCLKMHEDPRPPSGSETGPSTVELLGSVARTLDDGGCAPWQTLDPGGQDTYGAHSSTSIPDRARRLLELSTICEGSEPSTAERGTWPMRGTQHLQTPLAPSAFSSSDEDEQPHPIPASPTEPEPKYQQQVRSISSLALRMSDAQQPLQSSTTVSRTEVWAAAAGALNRKLAASAFGETISRTLGAGQSPASGIPHHRNHQLHSWKTCTLLYKSVPSRGPASVPGTDTSSEEAQPRQPVSGWLAARRRRLQRSVSMSALALQDRHPHVKQASSSTSPQLPPLSTRSKPSADGTTRASDPSSSRVHSNTSISRLPAWQQGYAGVRRSARASGSQVDPLSSSSYPSQVGCTPRISPRHSNTSVAKHMGHISSSPDNNDNSSHVLALQTALDTLRGGHPMTQPPSISQPAVSNLQASSLRELSDWPHSAPHSGSQGLLSESTEFLRSQGPHWRTHVRRASSLPLHNLYSEECALASASARARQAGLNNQQPGLESQACTPPVIQVSGAGLSQDPAIPHRHTNRISSHSAIGPVAHEKVSRFAGGRDQVTRSTSIDAHILDSTNTNTSSQHPQGLGLASSCISSPQQPLMLPTLDSQPSFVPHPHNSSTSTPACAGSEATSTNLLREPEQLHGCQDRQPSRQNSPGIALPPAGSSLQNDIASALTSSQVAHHNLPQPNTRDRSISLSHHRTHTFEQTPTPIPPTQHSPSDGKDAAGTNSDLHLRGEASTSDSSSSGGRAPLPATPADRQPAADPRPAGHRLRQPSTRAASFCFDARAEQGEDDEFAAAASPPSYFHNSAPQHHLSAFPVARRGGAPLSSSPPTSPREAQSMMAACSQRVSLAAPIFSQHSTGSTGSGSAMHTQDSFEERLSLHTSLGLTSTSPLSPPDIGHTRTTRPASHLSPRKALKGGARSGARSDESSGHHHLSMGNPDMVRHSSNSNLRSTDSLTSSVVDKDSRLEMFIVGGMSVASGGDGTGKRRSAPYVPPSYREPQMQTDLGLLGGKWEPSGSLLAGQSTTSLLISSRNTGRVTKDMGSNSRLSNLDVNSWAGTCAPKAVGGVTQVFGMETGQASRQLGVGTLQVGGRG